MRNENVENDEKSRQKLALTSILLSPQFSYRIFSSLACVYRSIRQSFCKDRISIGQYAVSKCRQIDDSVFHTSESIAVVQKHESIGFHRTVREVGLTFHVFADNVIIHQSRLSYFDDLTGTLSRSKLIHLLRRKSKASQLVNERPAWLHSMHLYIENELRC